MYTLGNTKLKALIEDSINNAEHRQILASKMVDGATYGELADRFNLSERRLKDIVTRGKARMLDHLIG